MACLTNLLVACSSFELFSQAPKGVTNCYVKRAKAKASIGLGPHPRPILGLKQGSPVQNLTGRLPLAFSGSLSLSLAPSSSYLLRVAPAVRSVELHPHVPPLERALLAGSSLDFPQRDDSQEKGGVGQGREEGTHKRGQVAVAPRAARSSALSREGM